MVAKIKQKLLKLQSDIHCFVSSHELHKTVAKSNKTSNGTAFVYNYVQLFSDKSHPHQCMYIENLFVGQAKSFHHIELPRPASSVSLLAVHNNTNVKIAF